MAVDILKSLQLVPTARLYPHDRLGKVRRLAFEFTQAEAAASDIGTTVDLIKLPAGRSRIILAESLMWSSAFGAARTLSFGFRAYRTGLATAVAEAPAELLASKDVSAALAATPISTAVATWKYDIYADDEVKIFATLAGGTMPIGAYLKGFFSVVRE